MEKKCATKYESIEERPERKKHTHISFTHDQINDADDITIMIIVIMYNDLLVNASFSFESVFSSSSVPMCYLSLGQKQSPAVNSVRKINGMDCVL